jgi:hypothetical protein
MTDRLPAGAISRLDGSAGDGIHLLWAAPAPAGRSVDGFTVQRRAAQRQAPPACVTLSAAELAALHRDHVHRINGAVLGFRSSPPPVPVPDPPDDPVHGDPAPPRPVCRELRNLELRSWPNPLTVQDLAFTVRERDG